MSESQLACHPCIAAATRSERVKSEGKYPQHCPSLARALFEDAAACRANPQFEAAPSASNGYFAVPFAASASGMVVALCRASEGCATRGPDPIHIGGDIHAPDAEATDTLYHPGP